MIEVVVFDICGRVFDIAILSVPLISPLTICIGIFPSQAHCSGAISNLIDLLSLSDCRNWESHRSKENCTWKFDVNGLGVPNPEDCWLPNPEACPVFPLTPFCISTKLRFGTSEEIIEVTFAETCLIFIGPRILLERIWPQENEHRKADRKWDQVFNRRL